MANPWDSSPFAGSSSYQDFINQLMQNTPWGPSPWSAQSAETKLDQYGNDFVQQFTNSVGRAPTTDEINQFFQQAVTPVAGTQAGLSGTDPNAVVQQYIPQAFQSQIQQNNAAKLPNLESEISNLATTVGDQTAANLADPKSQAYQQFSGQMNNFGITPSSGAFQAGEGEAVGNAASQTMEQLISSLGGGAIAGNQSPSFQNLYGLGQQANQGMTGYNQQLNDFNIQSSLAQKLADQSQPSAFATDLGYANTASNILGNLGGGAASAKKAGLTWICTAMNRSRVMTIQEINLLHNHLYKALWKKPFKFLKYLLLGRIIVYLAEKRGVYWPLWKERFYDDVMAEKDPVKAVDLYEKSVWDLYNDKRVMEQCYGS